jgi:aspartate aminotransferase
MQFTMDNKYASINLNIRGIGQSPTLEINELSKKLQSQGRKIYRMGLGQSPFPVPVPVVETLKNHAHEKDYLNVKGLEALRQAVADFHMQKDNLQISANNVLVGPGSKELMFLLQLVYYGDIILPTPCWVSYVPQAKIIGKNIRLIHTTFEKNWKLTADQLSEFLEKENDRFKPRLIVLNYPSNPSGETHEIEELKKIAKVAGEYELIILSDEIYGQLHYQGKHVSIASFYPEGTIVSSGLSKWCGAGGWRLGTFSFPENFEWLLNPMAAVASETYTSVSAPIQYAAVCAFKGSIHIERYLVNVRRVLYSLAKKSVDILQKGGIRVHMPSGAFYLFIDFSNFNEKLASRGINSSTEMCKRLLNDTGVAILPGSAFMQSERILTARLAFVNFDGAKALAMSESIPVNNDIPENFDQYCCRSVIEGIENIVDWVNK